MRLENKVALITGATGGMGSAEARLFAKEGASVVIAARKEDRGRELAQEIQDAGGKALFVRLDVTDQEQWANAVRQAKEAFGALHILVNNAGTNAPAVLPMVDMDVWNKVFATNVTGILVGIQICAPLMKESGGGSIINIGSIGGMAATFSTAYSSSKWALRGLSKSAAYTLAGWGIRCNLIQPGMIATDMTKEMINNPVVEQTVHDSVLLGRIGNAHEIATTALFLASDDSSYITGEEIVVDGGWYAAGPYLTNERRSHMLEMLLKRMS